MMSSDGIQCNNILPCGTEQFCRFKSASYDGDNSNSFGLSLGLGYCIPCPRDANGNIELLSCHIEDIDQHNPDTVQTAQSCLSACSAEATSKFREFEFSAVNEEEKCFLCPQDNVQYPDRVVTLLDGNITCSKLDDFFKRLPVSKDSSNFELLQSMNYICGCEGVGYAGASTRAKQNALVWMPRVSTILSILVRRCTFPPCAMCR
jgi:hypothetical protein